MTIKNARFWFYYNGDFVKLTLRPGQILHCAIHQPTDEGWTFDGEKFKHCGDHVAREFFTDGVDCDGRHSTHGELLCPLDQLAARWIVEDGYAVPDWQDISRSQRDYAAEAAGF
jgi:hypothetical protein